MAARWAVGMTPWGEKGHVRSRAPAGFHIASFVLCLREVRPLTPDPLTPRTYPPQPPGALRLVDVDEVGDHAALHEAALRLHADLQRRHTRSAR